MSSTPILDPAFQNVGEGEGLILWRIEDKEVVKQSEADGKFHTGDSYILLATTRVSNRLNHAVHFWLGAESSQDEMGIAAYKTVELDDSLGGAAVQYREVEGHESPLFLSYFKSSGIEYLPGGVATGFNKMEKDIFRTRLLHVKGKRTVRCSEVPCSTDSLNTGDVFILDAGLKLFLWSGPEANMYEKSKGVQTMQRIKDTDRAGRGTMTFMEDDPENADFWDMLGGYAEITAKGEPDETVERTAPDAVKLYHISDDSGSMVSEEVETQDGKLTADLLDSGDVYILDAGSELFVWVGRGSSVEEKKSGIPYATKFIEENGRDVATPVSRLSQGYESTNFKGYFAKWNPVPVPTWEETPPSARSDISAAAPSNAEPAADAASLAMSMMAEARSADDAPVDDGSGKLEIWRVEDFKLVPWPEEKYGQFYSGDSYVMLYTYLINQKEMYIIYFWQGRESSQDEIGASAMLAKEMDDKLNDAAVQVRVIQGKEPKHMRCIFKGRLVIHSGGAASGFKNSTEEDSYDMDGVSLFHVKGTKPDNTYGVQVAEVASSLNSGDTFVLLTSSDVFVWVGRTCSSQEVDVAETIANMLLDHGGVTGRTQSTIQEGSEPEDFWSALGGKGEYPESRESEENSREARLFQVSNATGKLAVDQICNFDQSDLCADDIMLLDTVSTVFVWVGSSANETERSEAMIMAEKYIQTSADGRSQDTPIVQVTAGNEPPIFTQHFRGWDADLTSKMTFKDPYEMKMAAAKEAEAKKEADLAKAPGVITIDDLPPAVSQDAEATAATGNGDAPRTVDGTVPYDQLKGYGNDFPGVDPSCREQYLEDTEFQDVFGMSKAEFASQPKWKQVAAKKAKDLF